MKLQSNLISPKVKGKRFRVISAGGGHNYPVGKVYTFKRDFPDGASLAANSFGSDMAVELNGGNSILMSSCFLLDFDIPTLKSMKENYDKQVKENQEQAAEIEKKIKFCEANGLNVFDEDIYQVDKVMEILKSKKSKEDKRKIIASFIKGESI